MQRIISKHLSDIRPRVLQKGQLVDRVQDFEWNFEKCKK